MVLSSPENRLPKLVPITIWEMIIKEFGKLIVAKPERFARAAMASGPINCPAGNFKVSSFSTGARIGASNLIGVKSLASFDVPSCLSS